MPPVSPFHRVVLIVLDGAGIGAMPDAPEWGDAGSDTFGHILESRTVQLPNLQRCGLGNIRPLRDLPPLEHPLGSYGRCALRSNGKDTTTGHWEIAGIILKQAFPTYPNGFPASIIDRFVRETSVPGILGNFPASGTEIIKELGEEHVKTRKPIVYTSADSVFQIAAHEEVIPLDRLAYQQGLHLVSCLPSSARARVIIWQYTAERALEHPWIGIGVNSTPAVKAMMKGPEDRPEGFVFKRTTGQHAHDIFLQSWYEIGAIGVLLAAIAGALVALRIGLLPVFAQPYGAACFAVVLAIGAFAWSMWQAWFMCAIGLLIFYVCIAAHAPREQAIRKPTITH